jgi:hypothetical protein
MGVKDKPRDDNVTSTEGDRYLASQLVRDVMHPRLLQRPREWGRQYVVFDTAASYPLYILTLTKQRHEQVVSRRGRIGPGVSTSCS